VHADPTPVTTTASTGTTSSGGSSTTSGSTGTTTSSGGNSGSTTTSGGTTTTGGTKTTTGTTTVDTCTVPLPDKIKTVVVRNPDDEICAINKDGDKFLASKTNCTNPNEPAPKYNLASMINFRKANFNYITEAKPSKYP
jgi:hypothetical protein